LYEVSNDSGPEPAWQVVDEAQEELHQLGYDLPIQFFLLHDWQKNQQGKRWCAACGYTGPDAIIPHCSGAMANGGGHRADGRRAHPSVLKWEHKDYDDQRRTDAA